MNKLFLIPLILFFLYPLTSVGETFTMDDLVVRNDLYYKKFTNVPFTGDLYDQNLFGSIVNGKKEGEWVSYYWEGQLRYKEVYKNGKIESDEFYNTNGEIIFLNYYKNGKT